MKGKKLMSQYLYAIIPYKGNDILPEEGIFSPCLPQLENLDSKFANPEYLTLYKDFLMINTCYRMSSFTEQNNGYSPIRAGVYKIAKALGATEVWYAEELAIEEMELPNFSLDKWIKEIIHKSYTVELSVDVLKGSKIWSYYHDDFSDIVIDSPNSKQ